MVEVGLHTKTLAERFPVKDAELVLADFDGLVWWAGELGQFLTGQWRDLLEEWVEKVWAIALPKFRPTGTPFVLDSAALPSALERCTLSVCAGEGAGVVGRFSEYVTGLSSAGHSIVIENSGGRHEPLRSLETVGQLCELLGTGLALDIGHATASGEIELGGPLPPIPTRPPAWVELHDNDGMVDSHLPIDPTSRDSSIWMACDLSPQRVVLESDPLRGQAITIAEYVAVVRQEASTCRGEL